MQKQLEKLTNQARFIQMIIDGKLVVAKKKKAVLVAELKQKGFKPFPKVKDASKAGELDALAEKNEEDADEKGEEDDVATAANAYDYLLGMAIWSLTQERVEKLLKQIGDKELEIDALIKLSKEDLWKKDLDDFINEWRFQLDDEARRAKKLANLGRRQSSKLTIGARAPMARKRKVQGEGDDSDFEVPKPKKTVVNRMQPKAGLLSGLTKSATAKPAVKTEKEKENRDKPAAQTQKKLDDVWLQLDGASGSDLPAAVAAAPAVSKAAKPPTKAKKAAASSKHDDESADEDDYMDVDAKPAAKPAERPARAKKPTNFSKLNETTDEDEEDDYMEIDVKPAAKTSKAPARAKKPTISLKDDDDSAIEDEDDTDVVVKPAVRAARPTAPAKKPTALAESADEDDYGEADDNKPVTKATKPLPKSRAKKPAASSKVDDDDDLSALDNKDDDEDVDPIPKPTAKASKPLPKAKPAPAPKKAPSKSKFVKDDEVSALLDDDDDEDESIVVKPAATKSRQPRAAARKIISYGAGSSDDDSDGDNGDDLLGDVSKMVKGIGPGADAEGSTGLLLSSPGGRFSLGRRGRL